jgi:hypothetical protein
MSDALRIHEALKAGDREVAEILKKSRPPLRMA